jgi:pimeloyl-ACP methyl ester carboxylesterase
MLITGEFMITSTQSVSHFAVGGTVRQYIWNWEGKDYQVVYEFLGLGKPVLLLPAFSTVSTRAEMKGIARSLAAKFQVVALDWLGFGQSDRASLDYRPEIYHQLLEDFIKYAFTEPVTIITAGHAAGYALEVAKNCPELVSKLILIAPTWLGPLRAMGASRSLASFVRKLVRSPLIGQTLYYLNTTPSFLRWMYRRHVYVEDTLLTGEFIEQKREITQQSGARYAPAAFVTGRIDPVSDRAAFLHYFQSRSIPILVVIAENAPPKSKAEMEAIAQLSNVETVRLPGTLGLHEEYPERVSEAISPFLVNS